MCIKNVNINGFLCENIIGDEEPSFINVSSRLCGDEDEEGVRVNSFFIVVFTNIIQARDEENLFINYECSLRITSFTGKTTELSRFRLGDNAIIYKKEEVRVCRNFATNKFFIQLKDYIFPDGAGKYILKILIRRKDELNNAVIENDTQFMMIFDVVLNDENLIEK